MRTCRFSIIVIILLLTSLVSANEARLLRFPDVSTAQVTFVYAGDIYVAPRSGGAATKLTDHKGLELFPKFSPDGQQVAFSGQYDGDMSVYVMPVVGGEPKRLTYHPGIQHTSERFGPENLVMGWHPDGDRVLFRSRKETNDWWDGRVYFVSVQGGLPEALPMNSAGFTSLSPDAGKVAYCPIYRDFRTWKRYKGGMAQDVWTFDLTTFENEKITDWVGTDNMPMWHNDKIYFNSDRTGTLNLFCYDLNTKETHQITQFTEFDVRWPSLGKDGIAFENGGWIYVLDLPSEKMNKLEIHLASDRRLVRPEWVDVSEKIRNYDISPDGKRALFSARGDIFTVPAKNGNTRNLTKSSGANDRNPSWSPDGRMIAMISDKSGEEELYLYSLDSKKTERLTTDGYCHKYGTSWSPDSKKLVFSDKELKLYYVDIATKGKKQIDEATRDEIRDFVWSPDSRYLAYTKQLDNRINAIFIYDIDDGHIRQVTPGYTDDFSPAFDPAGKYLYFLSNRSFNPILSNYEFQFANTAITNLYMIVLTADGESPFVPKSDEVELKSTEESKKKKNKDSDDDTEETVTCKIDFDGIYNREIAIDLPAGNYGGLSAIDGAVFYTSYPIRGLRGKITQDKGVLHKYDIKEQKDHQFANGAYSYQLTADGEKMILWVGGDYHIVETSGEKANLDDNSLNLSNMEMYVDRQAEFVQMFNETWRMERDFFYDENMHGVDWTGIRDRYAQLLPYCAHRFDLTYIIGEMIGELCCSHTYVGGGDKRKIPGSKVGVLGADFEIDHEADRIRITRILNGENFDKKLRSPLREPGIDVNEGDYLLAIDGHQITAGVNPYSLMVNKADRLVTLTVNSKPNMEDAHEVSVRPIASEESLRYFNWVEDRRLYVDSVSDGQIGYLHIPDMDSYGLYRFTKMFYHQLRKPGLIIDVRYNGGGFVSGLILERLRKVVAAMHASRTFEPGPSPGTGINAHMVTLINQFSCSDGDYFPYFFRQYELGPLMGKRTWGGVIGIRGYRPLIDGGYYTAPEFGIFSLDGKWIMENVGVEPDIEVDNLPDRMARGYDDQLQSAIDYVMDKIKKEGRPTPLPNLPGSPEPR
ncbi:MAG: protease [Candidatus Zixiibacteriota bacterium]|nr:MAG: protease [candidate division Zixibacteria bacterium]